MLSSHLIFATSEYSIRGHELRYFQFQGYDDSHNSWEPAENFISTEIVTRYHYSLQQNALNNSLEPDSESDDEDDSNRPRRVTQGSAQRTYLLCMNLVTEQMIAERNLQPIKVSWFVLPKCGFFLPIEMKYLE